MPEVTPSSAVLVARSSADPASFLRRTQELELIRRLFVGGPARLLTLTGPADIGKTRLALVLLAVSTDHVWCHDAFARAAGLAYPLLADAHPHGAMSRAYGVYDGQTGLSSRTLFVLDEHGVIRWSQTSPAAINPGVDGILTALEALGAPEAGSDGAPGSHPAARLIPHTSSPSARTAEDHQ